MQLQPRRKICRPDPCLLPHKDGPTWSWHHIQQIWWTHLGNFETCSPLHCRFDRLVRPKNHHHFYWQKENRPSTEPPCTWKSRNKETKNFLLYRRRAQRSSTRRPLQRLGPNLEETQGLTSPQELVLRRGAREFSLSLFHPFLWLPLLWWSLIGFISLSFFASTFSLSSYAPIPLPFSFSLPMKYDIAKCVESFGSLCQLHVCESSYQRFSLYYTILLILISTHHTYDVFSQTI